MSRAMMHDEAFAALDAVALDAIDPLEREAVMAHVASCSACRAELESLRDTASLLAFSSPLAADTASRSRDRIRSKLEARAAADRGRSPEQPAASPRRTIQKVEPRPRRAAEWLAAAAIALCAGSLVGLLAVNRDRARLGDALASQAAGSANAQRVSDSLRVALMSRDSIIAGMTGKDVAMVTLTAAGHAPPMAHMFWDHKQNTWTLVAHNLPSLAAGRTYQLWLVTTSGKVSAGTFTSVNGEAMVRATYALSPADLKAIAVTEEPAGGMPQPTGPMIIAGR